MDCNDLKKHARDRSRTYRLKRQNKEARSADERSQKIGQPVRLLQVPDLSELFLFHRYGGLLRA